MNKKRGLAAHLRIGRRGENAAARLLVSKGCDILARDWRRGAGELDIIARDGLMIVFVEVKSRRASSVAAPSSNLSLRQIRRIRLGAAKYLAQFGENPPPHRFDLIEVKLTPWQIASIHHHEYCYRERKQAKRW
ncbi:MAG: YraN family protein [Victivallaceae bacterium]|nr:YraN family protein [Victivallaceae bacterium]